MNSVNGCKFWSQASLPVRFDELGLRRAVGISLLASVSSVHATQSLVDGLTYCMSGLAATTELVKSGTFWDELRGGTERLTAESILKQKSWDEPIICEDNFE